MYILYIIACSFVLFLLAIVLTVPLRYTNSDYPFDIFKLLLWHIAIIVIAINLIWNCNVSPSKCIVLYKGRRNVVMECIPLPSLEIMKAFPPIQSYLISPAPCVLFTSEELPPRRPPNQKTVQCTPMPLLIIMLMLSVYCCSFKFVFLFFVFVVFLLLLRRHYGSL
jgi:hypothetical protein